MSIRLNLSLYLRAYIPGSIFISRTMDGSDMANFLKTQGYEIESFEDIGTNGLVTTKCGFCVSTNGYVYKKS